MSKQSEKQIFGASKNILDNAYHFVTVPVKIDSSAIAAVDGKKIVPIGTIVSAAGLVIGTGTEANAFGVLYSDCDCTLNDETASVVIHGVVKTSLLPAAPAAASKTAMAQIKFV